MNMIWHYNSNLKIELGLVVVQTAFEDDVPDMLRKNPPMIGAECYKVLPVIALKMRKFSSIKGLWHSTCRDSRPRLSGGAKLHSLAV
jgi:hypothetical protein